jgi:hypothetical protein
MLGGVSETEDYAGREAIDRARANLHRFAVVGLLEGLDLFRAQFRQRFGVRLELPRLNRRPRAAPSSREVVTAELRSRIAEVCRPDQEVYDYAARTVTGGQLAETR